MVDIERKKVKKWKVKNMSILYDARVKQAIFRRELKNRHNVAIETGISWHRITKIEDTNNLIDVSIGEIILLNNYYGDNIVINKIIKFLEGKKDE